jgi:hypothetical protein
VSKPTPIDGYLLPSQGAQVHDQSWESWIGRKAINAHWWYLNRGGIAEVANPCRMNSKVSNRLFGLIDASKEFGRNPDAISNPRREARKRRLVCDGKPEVFCDLTDDRLADAFFQERAFNAETLRSQKPWPQIRCIIRIGPGQDYAMIP